MSFDRAFQLVVEREGEWSTDPRDPGNWTGGIVGGGTLKGTRWGIASHVYPDVDLERLTLDEAKEIYRKDYWDKIMGEMLPAAVGLVAFDCAVNQGTPRAIRLLQAAVGVKQDGFLGPRTLGAISTFPESLLIERFLAERALHYASLPTFKVFGKGWMRRLFGMCLEVKETMNERVV